MATPRLTPAQMVLLRSVGEGVIERFNSCAHYSHRSGRLHKQPTAQVHALEEAGQINTMGVAMKHGQPMLLTERFADYHIVTLTPASEHTLETGIVPDRAADRAREGGGDR